MRNHALIILIAVAITLCLVTLANADADKSNLVKRNDPYSVGGGLYDYKNKKHKKKKHKNKNYSRRHFKPEIIEKRDDSDKQDPDLGEVSIIEDNRAALLKKRGEPPVSTGHIDANKLFPGSSGNP